ncbi:MAG: hypothetical protein ABSB25_04280 [Sedimentisphaerales bacterium]|jgi:hypothetical protein
MEACTITLNLKIVPGTRADYESLSHYHYRESHPGPCVAIFALKGKFRTATKLETVGVIVYSMPTAGAQMRNVATGGIFAGLDKGTRLALINKNIRTISRVIIEPRFRSLGLAVRLVRETMPIMDVPFVEALAVMGRANPFLEKAGLTRYDVSISASCVRLIEAFSAVGVDEQDLIDPGLVQQKLDSMLHRKVSLSGDTRTSMLYFIDGEMTRFLQSYGERRLMQPGIERTRFVLNKLTDSPRFAGEAGRPVYYLWRNPNVELRIWDAD